MQDSRRERHRQAQAKYRNTQRSKQLAEVLELEEHAQAIQTQLIQAKALARAAKQLARRLQNRIEAATSELADIQAQLNASVHTSSPFPAPSQTARKQTAATDPHVPSAKCPTQPSFSPSVDPSTQHFTDLPSIHTPRWHSSSSFYYGQQPKHHVYVFPHSVYNSGSLFHSILAWRADAARRLGCREDEICWLYKSERHPELPGAFGLETDQMGAGLMARMSSFCYATKLELCASLAILDRLEAKKAEGGQATTVLSNAFHLELDNVGNLHSNPRPPASPTAAPPFHRAKASLAASDLPFNPSRERGGGVSERAGGDGAASCGAAVSDASSLAPGELAGEEEGAELRGTPSPSGDESAFLVELIHSRLILDPPAGSGHLDTFPVAVQAARDDPAALERDLQAGFTRVLNNYLHRLHAADAHRIIRRIKSAYTIESPAISNSTPRTSADAFLYAMTFLQRELDAASVRVRSSGSPSMLHIGHDIDKEILEETGRMEEMCIEWLVFWIMIQIDQPHFHQSLMESLLAIMMEPIKYEEINRSIYQRLKLSQDQKRSLAALHHAYRRHVAALDAHHNALLSQLADLTSSCCLALDSALTQLAQPPCNACAHDHAASHPDSPHRGCACSTHSTHSPPFSAAHIPAEGNRAARSCNDYAPAGGGGGGVKRRTPTAARTIAQSMIAPIAVLLGLQGVLLKRNELQAQLISLMYAQVLSPRQMAIIAVGALPFEVDRHRLAGMAATDICCERVFGRASICANQDDVAPPLMPHVEGFMMPQV